MNNNIYDEKLIREKSKLILEFFNDKNYKPLKFKEMCFVLNVKDEDKQLLMTVLDRLIEECKISKNKNGKYSLMADNFIVAKFIGNKRGFGFARPYVDEADGESTYVDKFSGSEEIIDYFIPEKHTMNAFHDDLVLIKVVNLNTKGGRRREAEVVKIIERNIVQVIGTYDKQDGFGFVIPDNNKIADDIFVTRKHSMEAVTGHKVIVKITDYGDATKSPSGEIIEILGHINDPASDIITVVKAHNLPVEYPDDVMESLNIIPDEVSEKDKIGRKDLRNLPTVTIDGEDAKDLDDAITLSYSDGVYHLGVHIADVSHYVTENSPLDKEALNRGTSVYLVDSVIPMIPHKLSNGICSLNAGVDRLTLSCLMDIDEKTGEVISHEICEGLINVNERMNYTDVNKLINPELCVTDEDKQLFERYSDMLDMFNMMKTLSLKLRAKRVLRGSIDFDLAETKIVVDKNHKPVDIKMYDRNDATRLIEDFMLIANETVAEDYYWQELPFEYRVHEAPNADKVNALSVLIKNFGMYFKVSRDKIHPMEFQKLLTKIEGTAFYAMISKITLRTMQQAKYSTQCSGHFGLACKYYCHFTSPIRRYPDLQIHRIIKENLHGKLDTDRIKHYEKILPKVSADNSAKERRAEEAERDVVKLKEIEYMSEHLGEVFEGVISGFTGNNIFVELTNTVEGAVAVSTLHDDYYIYNEKEYCMMGERTKNMYFLGDKVVIKVMKCDKITRTIDFKLIDRVVED